MLSLGDPEGGKTDPAIHVILGLTSNLSTLQSPISSTLGEGDPPVYMPSPDTYFALLGYGNDVFDGSEDPASMIFPPPNPGRTRPEPSIFEGAQPSRPYPGTPRGRRDREQSTTSP